ncbi:unnamed protein product [Cylindrotheca closterium]|uniref:CCHC-type domain-containing protein n=1 Tax=Cylindrotheca closterium TaxID=2856 RepID=A0AAD2CV17_9STRA|nr:unnamed protein product [Cylindrotheca closterium]
MKKSADAEYDFLDFWEANQKFFAMNQGTTENLMHFKERFLRQAEVLQDLYGVAWFRDFAVKTKAYAAIASTDTAAQNKIKDDIFEAVLATGFLCKGKGKGKGKPKDGKKAACYVCGNKDHMSPKCPDRLLPKIQWKNQDQYVDYGKKLNLNQIGATVPATVPAIVPGASASTSGASSVAGSVNTPLRLAGTTGNQMMQVPSGMQLMQIPTQGGGTVTVPYSMNSNGEIAFSEMQLSQQGFRGTQVRQGFDATQARTPQAVKSGYSERSNVFHDAIKGKDKYGNDVYLIPCPAGTTNIKLQSNWHYAS